MKKGFTLIDILVVVAEIGLLVSIIIVGLKNVGKTGEDKKNCEEYSSQRVYNLPKECFDYFKNK